jgi:class 3 adenylate cyclase
MRAAAASLTDQDLEKLGVLLGDRRKMLRAIAAFGSEVVSAPQTSTAADPARRDGAERRHLTVMFADLVGSTALSARMDPEDLREVISAYQKCVAETVHHFGGFAARYMGDGVLVYFGFPRAHDYDAERAVQAGFELITAVTALKSRASLQTRIGIATGLVGGGAGAQHRWRDAEPRGAPAGDRRAERGRHLRQHAKTSRQSIRAGGPRAKGPQRDRRAGAGLGCAAGELTAIGARKAGADLSASQSTSAPPSLSWPSSVADSAEYAMAVVVNPAIHCSHVARLL